MNRHLLLLTLAQGLFLVNNVTFIAINGLVGLQLAPVPWMATLPVMGYVVGGALAAPLVARTQTRFGRRASFQIGLLVALGSALLAAWAAWIGRFELLILATMVAGYYNANGQLYRFAAAELVAPDWREKAVSLVLAGGLLGAVVGPNLAAWTRTVLPTPFVGAYLALALVALLASRNALKSDFEHVMDCIRRGLVPVERLATHETGFDEAVTNLPLWAADRGTLIKAIIRV